MTPREQPVSDATLLRRADGERVPPRANAAFMRRHVAHWIALGFGSGLSPWAWVAFLVFDRWLDAAGWGLVIGASLGLGLWACTRTAQHLNAADPAPIVWDEIVSFWIVLWLVMPTGWLGQAIAFALFRGFDAFKPGPIGWIDRRFKSARGWLQGVGIFADDLAAALCTLLVIAVWRFVFA